MATTRTRTPAGPSSAADFKAKFGIQRDLLTLPSGLTVRAKTAGMRAFISKGLVPNSLLQIITDAIDKGKQPDPQKIMLGEDGQPDMQRIQEIIDLMDAVTCDVLVEPHVLPVPTEADIPEGSDVTDPDDLRDDEMLYVDELDQTDKIFIFNWAVSGVKDLESFRAGLQGGVDAVADGSVVQPAPKRAPRARAR